MIESRFHVNDSQVTVTAPAAMTLLGALRDRLGLTGTKFNCEQGECGACTVLLDGEPVNACLVLVASMAGHEVRTVEGVAAAGVCSRVQRAFMDSDAAQCGYCTPGMVMSATALLERTSRPSREEIEESVAGNYCRCTGYESIFGAVARAADESGAR